MKNSPFIADDLEIVAQCKNATKAKLNDIHVKVLAEYYRELNKKRTTAAGMKPLELPKVGDSYVIICPDDHALLAQLHEKLAQKKIKRFYRPCKPFDTGALTSAKIEDLESAFKACAFAEFADKLTESNKVERIQSFKSVSYCLRESLYGVDPIRNAKYGTDKQATAQLAVFKLFAVDGALIFPSFAQMKSRGNSNRYAVLLGDKLGAAVKAAAAFDEEQARLAAEKAEAEAEAKAEAEAETAEKVESEK